MARPLRIDDPGCFWHVTSRGNGKADIVHDDSDRLLFLDLLGSAVTRFHWILYAYALMSNHFHLVLETTQPTLSRGMRWLNQSYAQAFNRRHGRVGHLFQGRFGAFLIDKENYFLEVLRYVVLNPVRAGVVASAEDGIWTSYPATVGTASPPDWLATDRALLPFGGDHPLARERFRRFVADGLGARSPWRDLVGQIYLGSQTWIAQTQQRVESRARSHDHPRPQREPDAVRISDVIAAVARTREVSASAIRRGRGGTERMMAAWIAAHEAQLPLREIGAGLNLGSCGHVSRLIAAWERELDRHPAVRAETDRCLELLPVWRKGKRKI